MFPFVHSLLHNANFPQPAHGSPSLYGISKLVKNFKFYNFFIEFVCVFFSA